VPNHAPLVITAAVEGNLDQAVLRRVVGEAGVTLGAVHGRRGKRYLREKLQAFNHAAQFAPWIVMVDLDEDADCAPALRDQWLPQPSTGMLFGVAVREVEAWLFGDPERLSRFLGVSRARIPTQPEGIVHAKRAMVDLGRVSRRREIREDLVPRVSSGRSVGPGYSSRLAEFVLDPKGWWPEVAACICDSLKRFIERLRAVVAR
jgi:hypothetical protein